MGGGQATVMKPEKIFILKKILLYIEDKIACCLRVASADTPPPNSTLAVSVANADIGVVHVAPGFTLLRSSTVMVNVSVPAELSSQGKCLDV
jgi:hypothetical protein